MLGNGFAPVFRLVFAGGFADSILVRDCVLDEKRRRDCHSNKRAVAQLDCISRWAAACQPGNAADRCLVAFTCQTRAVFPAINMVAALLSGSAASVAVHTDHDPAAANRPGD